MTVSLYVAQILIAIVLIASILVQAKGSGFTGAFSSETSVFRTRRGIQKTLFQFTIVLTVIFFIISIVSVKLSAVG